MYIDTTTFDSSLPAPNAWLASAASERRTASSSLYLERAWRQLPVTDGITEASSRCFLVSRWTDDRTTARQERSTVPPDRYSIAVALRPVRVRLGKGNEMILDGIMAAGMVHVAEPGQTVEAEFFSPCDFIHFHVSADYLHDRQDVSGERLHDLMVRDDLAAQLARTLTDERGGGNPLYAASVGQTILMRLLALRRPPSRVGALPKWRLRRVQEHLAANIGETITLSDLAEAAGLSRMHFAAQFRVATGCRPHDYLLQQRIECAKQMLSSTDTPLVQVALSVGFQTQSHFSTVFKRLTGDTPACWQRTQRVARDEGRNWP